MTAGSRRVRKSVIESCFGISQFLVLLGDMICPCVIPRWRVVTEGTNPGLNPGNTDICIPTISTVLREARRKAVALAKIIEAAESFGKPVAFA
jgi:hypothetical protein